MFKWFKRKKPKAEPVQPKAQREVTKSFDVRKITMLLHFTSGQDQQVTYTGELWTPAFKKYNLGWKSDEFLVVNRTHVAYYRIISDEQHLVYQKVMEDIND